MQEGRAWGRAEVWGKPEELERVEESATAEVWARGRSAGGNGQVS